MSEKRECKEEVYRECKHKEKHTKKFVRFGLFIQKFWKQEFIDASIFENLFSIKKNGNRFT